MNGPCSACGDGDTAMKYHSHDTDPLTTAAEAAWLEYARGTWSETDRRVFIAGWQAAMKHTAKKVTEQPREAACHFWD